ncbi:RPAP1-like protein [Biscogniauxia mediterranea]|nr:RPAP1-like protein [Biscogniauxia mediterranea]
MDPTLLIHDVKEKETTEPKAPSFPQIKSTTSGFPEPKKRTRISAFKQKRQEQGLLSEKEKAKVFLSSSNEPLAAVSPGPQATRPNNNNNNNPQPSERQRIDRENAERLASMSPQDIEAARQELFNGMDPSLLEMLLKRANLDEAASPSPFDNPPSTKPMQSPPEIRIQDTSIQEISSTQEKKDQAVSVEKPNAPAIANQVPPPSVSDEADEPETTPSPSQIDDAAPAVPPEEHIINKDSDSPKPHWPHPRQVADLDPNDPDFLQHLHEKYFPSLPADPSKLAWMAPVPTPNSPADRDSPYYPGQDSLPVSALRFDFRGMLLPPRISRAVPVSKGLHHHGEAPEAAGYTVRELARLQRSAVPGQRCVAYQTLGRVLYRLGRGQFGGPGDDMADGIWRQMEECAVLRNLHEEASLEEGRGHRSARAYAIEAIWLFEKGGWKERLRKAK